MAGPFFLDSTEAEGDGLSWGNAANTLQALLTGAVHTLIAGEIIYVAADHNEDPGGNITYTFPGTAAAPNLVISALGGSGPVTYLAATSVIQIDNSGGSRDIIIDGHVKFYGMSLKAGDNFEINFPQSVLFDDCILELNSVQAAIVTGDNAGQNIVELKNTVVNFSGGGASAGFRVISIGLFKWNGGTLLWTGTQPDALFNLADRTQFISVVGVDMGSITSAFVDVSDASDILAEFHHCKIGIGAVLASGAISSAGTTVLMSGCDDTSGNKIFRTEYETFYGTVEEETTFVVSSGGAVVDGTKVAWKMENNTNTELFFEPLVSPPFSGRIRSTGSKKFTVQCQWASGTPDTDQVWLEIEFLGTASGADTQSTFSDNGPVDPLDVGTAITTGTGVAWDGSLGSGDAFSLEITETVNRKGPFLARVYFAQPLTGSPDILYVDRKVTVTDA